MPGGKKSREFKLASQITLRQQISIFKKDLGPQKEATLTKELRERLRGNRLWLIKSTGVPQPVKLLVW